MSGVHALQLKRWRTNMSTAAQKAFWSYQASSETPSLGAAIAANAISVDTTLQQWEALSPGMRREIVRSAKKRG
jgi:hypothetical protein